MRSGGASGPCRARASTARHAYSAFAEIFIGRLVPVPLGLGSSELTAVEGVQPTLRLRLASPSARPLIFARGHRSGARPAADRGITLVVQRVVRHTVGDNERPDIAP